MEAMIETILYTTDCHIADAYIKAAVGHEQPPQLSQRGIICSRALPIDSWRHFRGSLCGVQSFRATVIRVQGCCSRTGSF